VAVQERLNPRLSSALDFVRWVSAEAVLIHHVRSLVFPLKTTVPWSGRGVLTSAIYIMGALGHQAVMIFFVLSGFLVGGSLLKEAAGGTVAVGRYLIHRVSRLYVVLIPSLVLGWGLDQIGLHFLNRSGVYSHHYPQYLFALDFDVGQRLGLRTAAACLVNLQTIVAPPLGSNGPLWSLANEFWYYLLFPLLVLPLLSGVGKGRRLLCAALAVAVGALVYPTILLYGSIWLLGALARMSRRALIPWPWVSGLLTLAALLVGPRIATHFPNPPADFISDFVVGLFFTWFLISLLHSDRSAALPFARVHTTLAGFSFSLYLLHFPFILLACAWTEATWGKGLAMTPGGWFPAAFACLLIVAANLYAWGVSLLTERHTAAVRGWVSRRLMPTAGSGS
jgi:peptidoglycan/LPS O-acetylase OafA/YrhL